MTEVKKVSEVETNSFKNCKGTADLTPKENSFIDQYHKESQSQREQCAVRGCTNQGSQGAHVESNNESPVLAPECPKHNNPNNTEPMELKKNALLVPVSTKKKN